MIRFNGFPFLEKEDHAYGVDVSTVMRSLSDIYTVPEKGMRVKDVGEWAMVIYFLLFC